MEIYRRRKRWGFIGLDIGIIIKPKTEAAREYLKNEFPENRDEYSTGIKYEFGYWRKTWNIRQRVIDVFELPNHDDANLTMTLDQLKIFRDEVLEFFLDKDHWVYKNEYSHVFSWEVELVPIANSIRDITLFFEYLDDDLTDDDFEIRFYDSY